MADPYQWVAAGEEWSQPWGGSAAQWFGTVLPRIHASLPTGHLLEIGCGYGRWTEFLRQYCERLTAVDSAAECVAVCRERFAADKRLTFLANDGRLLNGVADMSVDFAFTFDSLVHTTRETIRSYISELARVLTPNGRAFVHHSNLGAYPIAAGRLLPRGLVRPLQKAHLVTRTNQRSPDMTAELFGELCERAGLVCVSQELINWRSTALIDCLSTIARRGSGDAQPRRISRNPGFMREAELVRRRAAIYE